MAKHRDRRNEKVGRLTVIAEAPRSTRKTRLSWLCRCDCGNEVTVDSNNLRENGTRSCGCLQRQRAAEVGYSTKKDRRGERVGRLLIIEEASRSKSGRVRWHCKCDCGAQVEANGSDLYPKRTTSCGCLLSQNTIVANAARATHGHSRLQPDGSRKNSREYRSYRSMIQRCRNPNAPNFHLYGGRGISICEEWQGEGGFQRFLAYMGPRPPEMTLDRFPDNDGNYEPGNVRWATATEQAANRRQTPEYRAQMRANLDRGRRRTWDDPELREKLLASRKR